VFGNRELGSKDSLPTRAGWALAIAASRDKIYPGGPERIFDRVPKFIALIDQFLNGQPKFDLDEFKKYSQGKYGIKFTQ